MLHRLVLRWRLRRLIQSWVELKKAWDEARATGEIGDEAEDRFLAQKARVATRLSVLGSVRTKSLAAECRRHTDAMIQLLNLCSSLRATVSGEKVSADELEQAWHRQFLFLNQISGLDLAAREPLSATGPGTLRTGRTTARWRRRRGFGWWARLTAGGLVLGALAYLLLAAVGLGLERAGRLGEAGSVASGWGQLATRIWGNLPGRITDFLSPIAGAYGAEITIALFGMLLLSLGYWIFIRTA